jgi:hypothetical protein
VLLPLHLSIALRSAARAARRAAAMEGAEETVVHQASPPAADQDDAQSPLPAIKKARRGQRATRAAPTSLLEELEDAPFAREVDRTTLLLSDGRQPTSGRCVVAGCTLQFATPLTHAKHLKRCALCARSARARRARALRARHL